MLFTEWWNIVIKQNINKYYLFFYYLLNNLLRVYLLYYHSGLVNYFFFFYHKIIYIFSFYKEEWKYNTVENMKNAILFIKYNFEIRTQYL